jgi:hypothetical protein
LRGYGYHDHAAELESKLAGLKHAPAAVAVAPETAPASPAKKARRSKKAK